MKEGPYIAGVGALLGDPARANMLIALMAGRALTAGELAREAGVTAQTASGHLLRLHDGGLLRVVKQGRHRYFTLANAEVAELLEAVLGLAQSLGGGRIKPGPNDPKLRRARVCYDHLAGEIAVELYDRLERSGGFVESRGALFLPEPAKSKIRAFGVDLDLAPSSRRPLCRSCLDWSERRPHLAGRLGAALLARFGDLNWVCRASDSRALTITPTGERGLAFLFL